MKNVVALLLAGGASRRTHPVFLQKNAVRIRLDGAVKTVLEHQVERLLPHVKKLFVVVHMYKEAFGNVLSEIQSDRVAVVDIEKQGIAHVWKRLWEEGAFRGYSRVMSVNCDDIHESSDYAALSSFRSMATSVFFTSDRKTIDDSCAYSVVEERGKLRVKEVLGKNSGLQSAYVGTGVYILKPEVFPSIRFTRSPRTGEYEPDDVIKQIIEMEKPFYAVPVSRFIHVGDLEVLLRLAVRE